MAAVAQSPVQDSLTDSGAKSAASTMTSLLRLGLGLLLLVSCVQAQWLESTRQVADQCQAGRDQAQLENCTAVFYDALGTSASGFSSLNRTTICSNIAVWVSHTRCVNSVLRACLPAAYLELLGSAESTRESRQYWCDYSNRLRERCVESDPGYQSCYSGASSRYQSDTSDASLVDRTCRYLDAVGACYHDNAAACPGHSVKMHDAYWRRTYPPACPSSVPPASSPFLSLLLGACAVLLNKMAALP